MNGNSNNRQFGIRHRIYCVNLRSVKRILQLWGEKHPETYPDHDTLVWLLNNQYRSEAIYFLMEWIIEDINRFYSFRVIVSLTDQNEEIKREIERGQMGQTVQFRMTFSNQCRHNHLVWCDDILARSMLGLPPREPESPSENEKERSGYFQSGKPPNIPAEVLEEAEVITVEPNDDEFFDEMEASEQLREADTLSEGDTLP